MSITLGRLKRNTQAVLAFMRERNIAVPDDIRQHLGTLSHVCEGEVIEVHLARSRSFTLAYTISYCVKLEGVPIELRVNGGEGYSMIILKADNNVPGYEAFMTDPLRHVIQSRTIPTSNIPDLIGELERIIEVLPEDQDSLQRPQ